jgi:hypothetical protein
VPSKKEEDEEEEEEKMEKIQTSEGTCNCKGSVVMKQLFFEFMVGVSGCRISKRQ